MAAGPRATTISPIDSAASEETVEALGGNEVGAGSSRRDTDKRAHFAVLLTPQGPTWRSAGTSIL